MTTSMRRLLTAATIATVAAVASGSAAAEPSANASCLGQYVFFLAQTTQPNLGQGVVAPGATSAPGAVGAAVSADATVKPHTYHCSS